MVESAFVAADFEKAYGYPPQRFFFSPGRVNLIGEHIDYNGGYVFPAAVSLGITAAVAKRPDNKVRIRSANVANEVTFEVDEGLSFQEKDGWGNYPKGVFAFLMLEGFIPSGFDIFYSGDLPDGAGLSSSAAIEVLTAYMVLTMDGEDNIDLVWLARFCQKVENKFIGVNCGIMDQFSVALGQEKKAILLDCQSLEYQYSKLNLGDYTLVVMNTNKRRELADSKYNERRGECDKVLEILKQYFLYKDLCSAELDAIYNQVKHPVLMKRARHVVTENQRVLRAVEVLNTGNLLEFGALLNDSHQSLKSDYEVTGFELDSLVFSAQQHAACLGARMTGAGFGGCAISVVLATGLQQFKEDVGSQYHKLTGLKADFYDCTISHGVHEI
jgi:galactokinase